MAHKAPGRHERDGISLKRLFSMFPDDTAMDKTTARNALAEATRRGTYSIGASVYPRLQFWSIQEYMTEPRMMPKLPPMADPDTGKAVQADLFRDAP